MPHLAPSTCAAEWPAWVWAVPQHPAAQHAGHRHMGPRLHLPGVFHRPGSHCTTQRMFASLIWSVSRLASVEVYDSTEWASASMPVEAVSPAGSPTVSSGSRIM